MHILNLSLSMMGGAGVTVVGTSAGIFSSESPTPVRHPSAPVPAGMLCLHVAGANHEWYFLKITTSSLCRRDQASVSHCNHTLTLLQGSYELSPYPLVSFSAGIKNKYVLH